LWDDDLHLPRAELRSTDGLRRIWCELKVTPQYYPVVYSVFWVEYRLWGDATLGYHLTNIAWHALAALLVWRILRRLAIPGACLAAAIFALHPLQVESVAWITELKNTLSGVFYLAALLTYLRFAGRVEPVGLAETKSRADFHALQYTLALVLFVLAVLSKAVTATLPAAVLVILWWQKGRLDWRRDVRPLLPFFAVALAGGLLSAWMEHQETAGGGAAYAFTWIERCLIAGRAVWFYAAKLFWPADLVFIYPRWQVSQAAWWQYLFSAAAAGVVLLSWRIRSHTRAPLAALLFFGGTLFPALGFLNVFPFRYSLVADHFQYLACLALIVPVSAAAALFLRKSRGWLARAGYGGCAVLLAVLATLSRHQCQIYVDCQSLYQATIDRNPDCYLAHNNLGNILLRCGRTEDAIDHFRHALRINPDDAETINNLGAALALDGRNAEAIVEYRRALRVNPELPRTDFNLGNALVVLGRWTEAIDHYRRALRIKPEYAEAHRQWGLALVALERESEAVEHCRQALRIKPDDYESYNIIGLALAGSGHGPEAIEAYGQALRIKPGYADAHYNWGNALYGLGRMPEAMERYREALRLRPNYPEAHNNLANALATCGCNGGAIDEYRRATRLRPDYGEAHHNLSLALARAGKIIEAVAEGNEALRCMPDHPQVCLYLARLLATHAGDAECNPRRAVELAARACERTGRRDVDCLDTLAMAYAAAGQFDEAIVTADEARRLAQGTGRSVLANDIQDRLELYHRRRPYREAVR
jgi:tetratricopeptide (TPR) repeat protein